MENLAPRCFKPRLRLPFSQGAAATIYMKIPYLQGTPTNPNCGFAKLDALRFGWQEAGETETLQNPWSARTGWATPQPALASLRAAFYPALPRLVSSKTHELLSHDKRPQGQALCRLYLRRTLSKRCVKRPGLLGPCLCLPGSCDRVTRCQSKTACPSLGASRPIYIHA